MPNLFPATYLPHGNYKHILAQQASTHKVSPPGLLQIPRLCWSCLAPAIKDWVGRGDIYGGWPKRLALNLHLFQVLALNQLPAPEYLDCFLHATPSPWHPSSTNYLCQLYNTSCSPFDQRVCAVNAIKEQAKPPMQTPPKTLSSLVSVAFIITPACVCHANVLPAPDFEVFHLIPRITSMLFPSPVNYVTNCISLLSGTDQSQPSFPDAFALNTGICAFPLHSLDCLFLHELLICYLVISTVSVGRHTERRINMWASKPLKKADQSGIKTKCTWPHILA